MPINILTKIQILLKTKLYKSFYWMRLIILYKNSKMTQSLQKLISANDKIHANNYKCRNQIFAIECFTPIWSCPCSMLWLKLIHIQIYMKQLLKQITDYKNYWINLFLQKCNQWLLQEQQFIESYPIQRATVHESKRKEGLFDSLISLLTPKIPVFKWLILLND